MIFVAIIRSQRKALKDVILILICFIFLMSLLTYSLFYDSQPPPRADAICETWGCFQVSTVLQLWYNCNIQGYICESIHDCDM